MSVFATLDDQSPDRFGSGFAGAIALHILIAAVCVGLAIVVPGHVEHWGENASTVGAIQASMVSAIPLPSHVAPVEKSVLASENVTPAPKPPPKEATQPPPKPTDILIKEKTGLPVALAEDPLTCVVRGSGKALQDMDLLRKVTIV